MEKIYQLSFLLILSLVVQCKPKQSLGINENKDYILFDIDSIRKENLPEVDSTFLRKHILKFDKITEWESIQNFYRDRHVNNLDSAKAVELVEIMRYTQFFKVSSSYCGGYRHEILLKRRKSQLDYSEPYYGLFLVYFNKEGESYMYYMLAEKSNVMLITSYPKETHSRLYKDSILVSTQLSHFCSDVIVNGKASCTKDSSVTKMKLSCGMKKFISSLTYKEDY